jgi:adenosine kinase
MTQYAEECRALGLRYIYDPGQQCARSSGAELQRGLEGAYMLVCNDYEFELIRQKTGLGEDDVLAAVEVLAVTRGPEGSTIRWHGGRADVPAVEPERLADPTGVGDAYRAGFAKGLALGVDLPTCGRLGSVAAAYVLEHVGGQSHAYRWPDFVMRYERHFGPLEVEASRLSL